MYIDELRIRVYLAKNKLKNYFANLIVTWLSKNVPEILQKCIIGEKITIILSKYIPNDGKWHHFGITVDGWMMLNEGKKSKKIKKQIYIDGEKLKRRTKCNR